MKLPGGIRKIHIMVAGVVLTAVSAAGFQGYQYMNDYNEKSRAAQMEAESREQAAKAGSGEQPKQLPPKDGSGKPGPDGASGGTVPAPAPAAAPNVLVGAKLYVNPDSNARRTAAAWRAGGRAADAAQLDKIAVRPQAVWFGDWTTNVSAAVSGAVGAARSQGAVPVLIIYHIPLRDCGLYSAGGAASPAAYSAWIRAFAAGLGGRPAAVILEPDAVANWDCMSAANRNTRINLLREAVGVLRGAGASVYIDAGNARWHSAAAIAGRLNQAGIGQATGFALNVSNFLGTSESVAYGSAISRLVGGKHFVVDTSRNGRGPAPDLNWCNPAGRALGNSPTTRTGHPLADAYLWLKAPGESDGNCGGAPVAGAWWPEYALGLAQRAAY